MSNSRSIEDMNDQSRIMAARVKLMQDLRRVARAAILEYREIRARQAEAWRKEQKKS